MYVYATDIYFISWKCSIKIIGITEGQKKRQCASIVCYNSPLLRTNRKPQFIATIFTPITKRLSVFYLICGILIAVIVVGQLDLVNRFGKADRESYVNRAVVATCISLLHYMPKANHL